MILRAGIGFAASKPDMPDPSGFCDSNLIERKTTPMGRKYTTKEKIMFAAVKLFSTKGYDAVSMRDLAKATGIQVSSIYYHFKTKEDILKSMYAFYVEQRKLAAPTLESLLSQVETDPVQDVLMRLNYHFPPALMDTLDRILHIATDRVRMDKDSENFVYDHFFAFSKSVFIPVLNRMIELARISSVDVDALANLVSYFSYGSASLGSSRMKNDEASLKRSFALIFSLLRRPRNTVAKPKTQKGTSEAAPQKRIRSKTVTLVDSNPPSTPQLEP